jgi:hypothetical protein
VAIEDDLYGRVAPRAERSHHQHHRTTSDGYVINQDTMLPSAASGSAAAAAGGDDTDAAAAGELMYEEDDYGSEYAFDEATGQAVQIRAKKVSFAAEDERFVIERPGEVKGLGGGLSKLFSFGPPKPMKSLPGSSKEKKLLAASADSEAAAPSSPYHQLEVPPVVPARSSPGRGRSTSKEASPAAVLSPEATSPKAFIAAMTGGLLGGVPKSPDPSSRNKDATSPTATTPTGVVGSVFGTLLKRGRNKTASSSSKPGSKTGSRTSSADRSSQDLGSEDLHHAVIHASLGVEGSMDPHLLQVYRCLFFMLIFIIFLKV